ncbi:DUF3231 family protein [Oceanobacillus halophilus]|uniref:DUF3231 family protein n=1 Tax=Oceanobacillus halophilus TaxID=930130 RepID=A0A494ZXF9_9BACI|nr:DUF3231 family protein [Oceanobacillus halophilus]RKQ29667.1 DUF3231 family protein [Oceanobacillus halophilus]
MGILSGNPKEEPMHYGEVHGTWSFINGGKGMIAGYQVFRNHAGDRDLIQLIDEVIKLSQQQIKEVETLLKENGVGLPPTPPERPKANLDDIPTGARAMDQEIAATMSADTAAGLISCSTMIGQAIREDIATMFGQFHTQKATLGAKILRLNKEKGWLVPPPLHNHHAEE